MIVLSTSLIAQTSGDDTLQTAVRQPGEITLSASVDKNQVALNRPLELLIRIKWYGDLDKYQVHQFDNPILNNLEITGHSASNKVSSENGRNIAIQDYVFTLKPQELGMGYIEGVIIRYTDMDTDTDYSLSTNRIEIKVLDPIPEPGDKSWIIWLAIIIMLAGVAFFTVIYLQKRKAEKIRQAQLKAEKAVPMEEKYLQELKDFNLDDPGLDIGKTINRLSRLLRRFLAEKFNLPADTLTTEELVRELTEKHADEHLVKDVNEVLSRADVIKFSGGDAEKSELERLFGLVKENIIALRNKQA
ncbi:MAG TPA: BatD family protein [bacterium]|nr:BatD family protein [bacterium]HPN44522.1 BatD family protein [bacterium]